MTSLKTVCVLNCQTDPVQSIMVPDCHFRHSDTIFETGRFFCHSERGCMYAMQIRFQIKEQAPEELDRKDTLAPEPPPDPKQDTLREVFLPDKDSPTPQPVEPWLLPNEYGERPGDICCQRADGTCYEHDFTNYRLVDNRWVFKYGPGAGDHFRRMAAIPQDAPTGPPPTEHMLLFRVRHLLKEQCSFHARYDNEDSNALTRGYAGALKLVEEVLVEEVMRKHGVFFGTLKRPKSGIEK